ncbi:MAG: hypothetical protein HYU36_10330 [Planctomycetes bacterium]|nr:hypothetical protein [Planctomycetota bacterium]
MTPSLVESWKFKYDGLAGYFCGGHEHGIELTAGADGRPVTRPMGLNLEHYYARSARGGRFVPRYKAEVKTEKLGDNGMRLRIAPCGSWQVGVQIDYRLLPNRVIEARFELTFHEAFQAFEAFVSNYFHEPVEPFVHVGGVWMRPQLGDREHRYWARSNAEANDIRDGRLDEFLAEVKNDYRISVDPQPYDCPILISPIRDTGWSLVHVVEPGLCPSLSANRTWHAHDFSLVGRDVSKDETVSARAWMAYQKLESLDDALRLFEGLTGGKAS